MQRLTALVRLEKDTVLALQRALNGAGESWAAPERDPDSAALVISSASTSQTWEVQPLLLEHASGGRDHQEQLLSPGDCRGNRLRPDALGCAAHEQGLPRGVWVSNKGVVYPALRAAWPLCVPHPRAAA